MRAPWLLTATATALLGCGLGSFGELETPTDAAFDARGHDARAPETDSSADSPSTGDSSGADTAAPDSGVLDSSTPDVTVTDSSVPDTSAADTALADTNVPDTNLPDTNVPDTNLPDTNVADTNLPDTNVPDTAQTDAASCSPTDNGTTTLYYQGNASQPWSAYCSGGKTYLVLPAGNFSSYPSGSCAQGSTVTTTWSRVNIDPASLVVDTSDLAGAMSSGALTEVSTAPYMHPYDHMPYASTRSCIDMMPTGAPGAAIALPSHFAVAPSQTWADVGYSPSGNHEVVTTTMGGQSVTLAVGGYPAGLQGSGCSSDYYTTTGGKCLQLVYVP